MAELSYVGLVLQMPVGHQRLIDVSFESMSIWAHSQRSVVQREDVTGSLKEYIMCHTSRRGRLSVLFMFCRGATFYGAELQGII